MEKKRTPRPTKIVPAVPPDTFDWQRAFYIPLTILAWVGVAVVAVWLLQHVAKTVLTLVLSAIVAFALSPLVSLLERWMPRSLAIALAYVVGFIVVLGLGALLIITAAAQVTTLVHELPHYAREARSLEPQVLQILGPFGVTHAKLLRAEGQVIAYLQTIGTAAAKDSLAIVTGVLGTIIDIILVLILSIYFMADGQRLSRLLRREAGGQRRRVALLIEIVNQVVGGYVRGQLALSALIGFLVGLGMLILQVPYAVLLGVLAFFMEFIPVVGVLVSGAVSVLVALFQGWLRAVLVLAYFIVVHVIEGDVVGPRIMARAVGIHPATALIALVAGTELFGIWGALFAAPLAGLLQAIGTALWRELRGANPEEVIHEVADEVKEQNEPGTKPAAH